MEPSPTAEYPPESELVSTQVTETVVVNGEAFSTVTTTEIVTEGGVGGEEAARVTTETIEGNVLEI